MTGSLSLLTRVRSFFDDPPCSEVVTLHFATTSNTPEVSSQNLVTFSCQKCVLAVQKLIPSNDPPSFSGIISNPNSKVGNRTLASACMDERPFWRRAMSSQQLIAQRRAKETPNNTATICVKNPNTLFPSFPKSRPANRLSDLVILARLQLLASLTCKYVVWPAASETWHPDSGAVRARYKGVGGNGAAMQSGNPERRDASHIGNDICLT